ncbi:hypothetical protein FSP39_024266 [Pinctada imbricata]|uniref:Integrase catalytic domain-containing protein n=1 Tax=Pinctada imbricata TaxID=66713 RepID=A0AA88Y5I9_PINIB|nr:hypothetical protein FSP39_024266 [Pinctada imbricata]
MEEVDDSTAQTEPLLACGGAQETKQITKEMKYVLAIDIGTMYSGYAYNDNIESERDPLSIKVNTWQRGSPMSLKAPTIILFDIEKNFHSFGNAASKTYATALQTGKDHIFICVKEFKMSLYHEKKVSNSFILKDTEGRSIDAMIVFTNAIKSLKIDAMADMSKRLGDINEDDVTFILTVPAIWREPSKQFMRIAAEKRAFRSSEKTGLKSTASSGDDKVVKCPLHHTAHSINKCRAFLAKTFADRIKYLREKNICLRCCESDSHWKKDCTAQIKCTICNSDTHTAALHKDKPTRQMQVNKGQNRDKEVRPEIKTLKTELGSDSLNLGSHRFERFSNWRKLIRAVSCLQHIAQTFHGDKCSNGWHTCDESHTVHALSAAQNHIFRVVQHEIYHEEIECLKKGQSLSKSSPVLALSPYLDNILRVGGRLDKSCLTEQEKHPILIPGRHNIAKLIIGHYHDAVYHQGRHITEGSILLAGIWITAAKSLVSSFISKCVKCRKLRGQLSYQKMANLPPDRSEPSPPFTCVGVDCFGPWQIVTRRTRGGQAASKRWGVMFTCLSTRAVHIEVIEELSSSSFINALRRLIAIRGPVRIFRSDRGTNFVGSTEDLGIQAINTDDTQLKEFLSKNQSTWLSNPPHASHMGGVWERMIGVTRNILNSLLMDLPGGGLTHEVLVTFLAEVSAIINSRPLVALTTDPDEPLPLTPSLLLTQKSLVDTGFCTQIDMKDMYKKQWKRVQVLAEMFWTRWKDQYLQSLQNRRKWQIPKRNFCSEDVVLVRDKQSARNNWPVGIVQETYAGHDGLVRKVNVRVVNDGHISTFTRPVVELVLLVEND